jgi:hypothetical protein
MHRRGCPFGCPRPHMARLIFRDDGATVGSIGLWSGTQKQRDLIGLMFSPTDHERPQRSLTHHA